MKKRIYIIAALATLNFSVGFSQSSKIKKAKKTYNKFSYVSTTKTLLTLAENGTASANEYQQLANSYYFTGDMKSALKWYEVLMSSEDKEAIASESYFRYVQSLKASENYEEANEWMAKFADLQVNDSRGKAFKENPGYLKDIARLSDDFALENLSINTKYSDFGTSLDEGNLIFASSRGEGKNYSWNEQPFLDLYTLNAEGGISALKGAVNTRYHESSSVVTKDGNTLYFTRNNYFDGKFKKNDDGAHSLKIYKATKVGGEWTNIEMLPFNNDNYNVGHPALNADETSLYFSSDMPGGKGASDLYKVAINADGTFGFVENLGDKINTEGRENFPFISTDGTLYFSSNGHLGLGGLDVFKVAKGKPVYNLGKPINSPKDDFAYMINNETLKGFVSSNRTGGKGDDDIYSFTKKACEQMVTGTIVDATTKELLANATVLVYNEAQQKVETLITDASGAFSFMLACKKQNYKITTSKLDFEPYESSFKIEDIFNEPVSLELPLTSMPKAADVGTDLFKMLDLKPILFDYDKSNIRPDAEIELRKVIAYMKEFPKVKIDIRSHTDSRGRDAYNLALSKRRNVSTVSYIVEKGGIAKDKITGKGYGETQLANKCSNGVRCSKVEHQENRRSEFIITEN